MISLLKGSLILFIELSEENARSILNPQSCTKADNGIFGERLGILDEQD